MPAIEHIPNAYIGQTLRLTISVTQDSGNKDLSLASAITFKLATPTPVSKSLGSGIAVNGAPYAYQITVLIDPADTASVDPDQYDYQVWVTDENADKAPVTIGHIRLFPALN